MFALLACVAPAAAESFRVTLPATAKPERYDGRVILLIGAVGPVEPRDQLEQARATSPQVFGVTVDGLRPGGSAAIGGDVLGFPAEALKDVPAGTYSVQAVLHRYDTYKLGNGRTVKLPAARGAGQNWRKEPGNLFSTPKTVTFDPARPGEIALTLDRVNPPIAAAKDSKYVRHIRFRSPSLSQFWGRPTYMTAHVLLPEGYDAHPKAHYPVAIFHGHFPDDISGFRITPPDPNLPCKPSERFALPCYNRTEQEEAYAFYRRWTGPDFPRFLVVEIDHSNPYYDDSYAVNSANLGPYGDAITKELLPAIERRFRGIGAGWARFLYGGSTGGWETLAVQVLYPDDYNGAFAACPDPVDFRAYTVTNIYDEPNLYWTTGTFGRVPKPAHRDWLGRVQITAEQDNRLELVLGDRDRSGGQWDIWEAVFSPQGADGYPVRLYDKRTGAIDPKVAAYWRENYDLVHIMQRDWATLGPKLRGKIHLYVGDMDNYYLNDAVYLAEDFLNSATPPADAEIRYGDRFEHCWNGDPDTPNALTRLRYNTMYADKMVARMEATAPKGADLRSWRY